MGSCKVGYVITQPGLKLTSSPLFRGCSQQDSPRPSLLLLLARATCVMVLFFAHIPFVVKYTINATPPERLQQLEYGDSTLQSEPNVCFESFNEFEVVLETSHDTFGRHLTKKNLEILNENDINI